MKDGPGATARQDGSSRSGTLVTTGRIRHKVGGGVRAGVGRRRIGRQRGIRVRAIGGPTARRAATRSGTQAKEQQRKKGASTHVVPLGRASKSKGRAVVGYLKT